MTGTDLITTNSQSDLTSDERANLEPDWDCPPQFVERKSVKTQDPTDDGYGDLKTWLLIALMCSVGLILAITAYLLPAGQHAVVPPIKVY